MKLPVTAVISQLLTCWGTCVNAHYNMHSHMHIDAHTHTHIHTCYKIYAIIWPLIPWKGSQWQIYSEQLWLYKVNSKTFGNCTLDYPQNKPPFSHRTSHTQTTHHTHSPCHPIKYGKEHSNRLSYLVRNTFMILARAGLQCGTCEGDST